MLLCFCVNMQWLSRFAYKIGKKSVIPTQPRMRVVILPSFKNKSDDFVFCIVLAGFDCQFCLSLRIWTDCEIGRFYADKGLTLGKNPLIGKFPSCARHRITLMNPTFAAGFFYCSNEG